jgi:hypothetical protein
LIGQLLRLAQSDFISGESFFGRNNPESHLFIPEHKGLNRMRGTRTTTIIVKVDSQITAFEKTYI